MKMKLIYLMLLAFSALTISCTSYEEGTNVETANQDLNLSQQSVKKLTKADSILIASFEAHGGELYHDAHYSFSFRNIEYEFENNGADFTYRRTFNKEEKTYKDQLENGNFTRIIDGQKVELSEKDQSKYSSSVNSVIYFATLPHKLLDAAVISNYGGSDSINGVAYELLEISFRKEGGGEDFDDQYLYWINKTNHQIDYLAYNYQVNEGGVRFRSAYNVRRVEGIIFQDYVNYKAEKGTPLKSLSKLFESGSLKELSRIETEEVRVL